ncbi:MAG: hypothetical protein BWY91_02427 [bacterium ADurb.BinA028]|nr:MAG: hypothetical protein BWY91_02427 [bacterium ADurb.BinA028]
MAAAPGCTCQKPRAETSNSPVHEADSTRSRISGTLPAAAGIGTTTTAPPPEGATTSTAFAPDQSSASTPLASTRGSAIGHCMIGRTACERVGRSPARPARSTANSTLVRQPKPSTSPGTGSTSTERSMPASRHSCSATTAPLSRRWAARSTCCQSHPPHPPGPAWRHTGSTRSADGERTSTASARRKRSSLPPSVTFARTRSPGKVCRTKTTRPSCRATQKPPWATGPTSTSKTSPTSDSPRGPAGLRGPAYRRCRPDERETGLTGRCCRRGQGPSGRPSRPTAPRTSATARARWRP